MEVAAPLDYQIRFRHLDGDVGPFPFQPTSSVGDMKNSCFEGWPTEGDLKDKKPSSPSLLKIMYQGKMLDNSKTIKDLERLPGEMVPGKVLTLHLLIAPPGTSKPGGVFASKDSTSSSARPGCCSIQ